MPKAKTQVRQHYVPKFLLNHFACNPTKKRGKKVFVYDKWEDKIFVSNVSNVTCEGHFYDFEIKGYDFTMEPGISGVESKAAVAVNKLIKEQDINQLTIEEQIRLAQLAILQMVRVPKTIEMMTDFSTSVFDWIEKETGSREYNGEPEPTENETRMNFCKFLGNPNYELVEHLLKKVWTLMTPPQGQSFYTSDNPIVMQNTLSPKGPFRGNCGIGVEGIEIYFPLSKKLILAMICPSYFEKAEESLDTLDTLAMMSPGIEYSLDYIRQYSTMEDLLEFGADGTPEPIPSSVVENVNSMQVVNSTRYIISAQNDFSLAKEMIEESPELKTGSKPTIYPQR